MVHHHVRLPGLCRQILCHPVQGQAAGMPPQQSGHHAGHAQLQRIRPKRGAYSTAVSQYDLLSVLLQDQDQTMNEMLPLLQQNQAQL